MRFLLTFILLFFAMLPAQDFLVETEQLSLDSETIFALMQNEDPSVDDMATFFFGKSLDEVETSLEKSDLETEHEKNVLYLGKDKFRVDMVEEGDKMSHIMDQGKQKIYSINWAENSYYEIDIEKVREMREQMEKMMAQQMPAMEQMMANMPPEAKARMKQMGMMGGEEEQPVDVKSTGRSLNVNGYDCEEYIVSVGDSERRQYWITTEKEDIRRAFEGMLDIDPMGAKTERKVWDNIKEGWPAASTEISSETGYSDVSMYRLISIEEVSHPSGTFLPPSGFKKKDMPEMGPGAMPTPRNRK